MCNAELQFINLIPGGFLRDATGMKIRYAERFVCIQIGGNNKRLQNIIPLFS